MSNCPTVANINLCLGNFRTNCVPLIPKFTSGDLIVKDYSCGCKSSLDKEELRRKSCSGSFRNKYSEKKAGGQCVHLKSIYHIIKGRKIHKYVFSAQPQQFEKLLFKDDI